MAKDPAFLFYPNDYIGGTMGMTFEEKGAYMDLLMMQFNRGHMTKHMIAQTVGQIWDKIKDKFMEDENGLYYNVRLEEEKIKRQNYTKSRRNNKSGNNQYTKKHLKNDSINGGHMTSHMENENENNINNTIIFQTENLKREFIKDTEYLNKLSLLLKKSNDIIISEIDNFVKEIELGYDKNGNQLSYRPLGKQKDHFKYWLSYKFDKSQNNSHRKIIID